MTNEEVIEIYKRRKKLKEERDYLAHEIAELELRWHDVQEELYVAHQVTEVYKGVALRDSGIHLEAVGDEIDRYARLSETYDGSAGILYLGDDPYGSKGEKWYGSGWEDRDEMKKAALKWILKGEKPENYPSFTDKFREART
jgi:hypothetical protein